MKKRKIVRDFIKQLSLCKRWLSYHCSAYFAKSFQAFCWLSNCLLKEEEEHQEGQQNQSQSGCPRNYVAKDTV
ncbi:MAG: hypothetical protein COX62_05525, partial [Deltaproteobacteria bacterium CG_4_10_14_0_2_um_filter_43_8]